MAKKQKTKRFISIFLIAAITVCSLFTFNASGTAAEPYKTYKKSTKSTKYLVADGYDYSAPVPKNYAVGNSYFNDAVFIGDSRGVDLMIYTDIKNTKALPYCDVGLNVSTAFTKEFVSLNGSKVTVLNALKKKKKKFTKVYLMFGINELGYSSVGAFIKQYSKLVDAVREINKNAIIYVHCVVPVSKQRDNTSDTFTNVRINKWNKYIKKMCKDKKLFYIDAVSAFSGADGYLPDDAAYDGIHYKPSYSQKWLNYLRTRTLLVK